MTDTETEKLNRSREQATLQAINPVLCFQSLPENERAYVRIPQPAWLDENDQLRPAFDRYPDLWLGGKVVWGYVIQANKLLFSPGLRDSPGEVIYDPRGKLGYRELEIAAQRLTALKGTTPDTPELQAIADYLADEKVRVCGLQVPNTISRTPLLISSLLFHRGHLPEKKISFGHVPLLINNRFPGVVTVMPSRWWPDSILREWLGDAGASKVGGTKDLDVPAVGHRQCSNCREPMRKLGLAAHYERQVQIDVCEPCSLIWFDDTESARLAGPGLADLVRVIHGAMQTPRSLQPLPPTLPCVVCKEPLKRVSNVSRFGRTAQLECTAKHGAYQSFALFLAEKGYFRPYSWGDIKQLTAAGKHVLCFNCGAELEPRPQDECSYCKSPVGMIDPVRLASAINVAGATVAPTGLSLVATIKQSACPCCGGAIDLTAEMVCPHCRSVVRPVEPKTALNASEAVEQSVRDNYAHQQVDVSRRKLNEVSPKVKIDGGMNGTERTRRLVIIIIAFVTVAVVAIGIVKRSAHDRQEYLGEHQKTDMERGLSPVQQMGVDNARAEARMAKIPHAPAGSVPPQLNAESNDFNLKLTSQSGHKLQVKVNLINEFVSKRCTMVNADDPARNTVSFSRSGETHTLKLVDCDAKILNNSQYEYTVWDVDDNKFAFMSDSAFFP